MKRRFILLIIIAMVLGFSMQAHADLNLIGQGTSTHGTYNLIYDTDLDITWYDYSSQGDWQSQVDWAATLTVNAGGIIYDDWRLPTTVDGLEVWGYDGTTTTGYNITTSEMGHLFYTELGNTGYYDTSGNLSGCSLVATPLCFNNPGDFQNLLQSDPQYYSGTEYSASTGRAWMFNFSRGMQTEASMTSSNFMALAVRNGLAVVPEPISSILFITGGTLLAGKRLLKRKRS